MLVKMYILTKFLVVRWIFVNMNMSVHYVNMLMKLHVNLEKKYGETTEKYRELQTRYFEKSEQWVRKIIFF